MSGRRVMTDIRNAQNNGQLEETPSFTSVHRYLRNPELTPLLVFLIEQSAVTLNGIEEHFAMDSSGFATSVYFRWFDHKWGKERREIRWVKAHIACGVLTNVVTAVKVTHDRTHDSKFFIELLQTTAENFNISEVSADKAYLSRKSLHAVDDVGGVAYIPFKKNSLAIPNRKDQGRDSLWERAHHFYMYHREAFYAHYHRRSNVETAFSMIKAKFGASVRSRTKEAQVNEVLAKILCHNICVVIQSMHELDVIPEFQAQGLLEGTLLPSQA